jgi:hypothetical protein
MSGRRSAFPRARRSDPASDLPKRSVARSCGAAAGHRGGQGGRHDDAGRPGGRREAEGAIRRGGVEASPRRSRVGAPSLCVEMQTQASVSMSFFPTPIGQFVCRARRVPDVPPEYQGF